MPSPSSAPDPEASRLDSWKQIAAYLDKSERTVRRWQETEGLPVHKHLHRARGSVWAYRHEIDEWLAARRVSPRPLSEEPAAPARRRAPLPAMGALAVAAFAVAAWVVLPRRTPPLPAADPETLTALPGAAYAPAISADGRHVAFYWAGGAGPGGIFRKIIGADAVTPVISSSGAGSYVYSPAWSPDGSTIAYLERVFPGSQFAPHNSRSETWLCLTAASGGPPRRLIRLAAGILFYGNHSHLSWSRDGRHVLAPMADGARRGIHWIPAQGGEPRRITDPKEGHHHAPALSPDGRALVYLRQTGPDQAAVEFLYRQNLTADGAAAGDPLLLSETRSMTSGVAWTASGNELIVCRAYSALVGPFDSRLFRMPADGPGDPVALGLGQCSTVAAARGPAGTVLVYGSGDQTRSQLWRAPVNDVEAARRFAPSSRFDALPAFSPDGAFVAFVSNRSGRPEVWLAGRDGNGARKLTAGSNVAGVPQWSPDGGWLTYGSASPPAGKAGGHAIHVLPLAGGEPRRVPLGAQAASDPAWMSDGKRLRYWSGGELWRADTDGSSRVKLGHFPARFIWAAGLAGPELFYAQSAAPFEIRAAPVEGPGAGRIFAEGLAGPAFALSAKFAYFIKAADRSFYAKPLAGGPERRLGKADLGERRIAPGIAVSPDDRDLIRAITDEPRVDLMLVRGFQ